jgi:hypothetical protein
MTVEERLADLTADLVEYEENSVFLKRLFSLKAVHGRTSRLVP